MSAVYNTDIVRTGDDDKDRLIRQIEKGIDRDYILKVEQLSRQDSFEISLGIPSGKQIIDPIDPEKVPPIDDYEQWESKTFTRQPLTPQQHISIEKLKVRFNTETDPAKVPEQFARLYQWLAFYYLDMTFDDFARCNWDELKIVLDACNFRTVYGLDKTRRQL